MSNTRFPYCFPDLLYFCPRCIKQMSLLNERQELAEVVSAFGGTGIPQSREYIDGLVQDCSNSIANALELLQSCTKPLTYI